MSMSNVWSVYLTDACLYICCIVFGDLGRAAGWVYCTSEEMLSIMGQLSMFPLLAQCTVRRESS